MYIERDIEGKISKWIEKKEIIVIRGPRQAGKTTLIKKIKKDLDSKNKQTQYINFEEISKQTAFENDPKQYIERYLSNEHKIYVFMDEVQYIKNAGHLLKLIYDTYENIKLIITGSSTLDLNNIGKFLVGRAIFFELYPFSFGEFLKSKDKSLFKHYEEYKIDIIKKEVNKKSVFINELNNYLEEYITYGGYPRIVLEKEYANKKVLLENLFYTYIEKDIISLYGIKYKDKVIKLIKYLANTLSAPIKYEDITKNTGFYFEEIKDILSILESTYIIKKILPYHKNKITELRKNPKIYFIDLGIRNITNDVFTFDNITRGFLYENFVFREINTRSRNINFWQTTKKAEVDFVIEKNNSLHGVEVKNRFKTTKGLWSFMDTYNVKKMIVTDIVEYNEIKKDDKTIIGVPIVLIW